MLSVGLVQHRRGLVLFNHGAEFQLLTWKALLSVG